ncbi:MAG: TlpA family protein disulfide reductase [Thiohalorhabdus sp.]|uniref:TlpA family protein disulfide reductase n=1 Tax=Thiohalorhabdus sp. TaxID=3094134 RepID=UPI00397FF75E
MASAGAWALPSGMSPMEDRPEAPKIELQDLDGESRSLDDLRGKVVLVNFWATWCPPCREEMPSMQRLYEDLEDRDFEILAVNVGEQESTVFSFTQGELETEITFPILLDSGGELIEQYPVQGLPTTFLVDREGRLAYKAMGGRDMAQPEFKEYILELLEEG